jgi:hypothetical protein
MNYQGLAFAFENDDTALPATRQLAGKASFFSWHTILPAQ